MNFNYYIKRKKSYKKDYKYINNKDMELESNY